MAKRELEIAMPPGRLIFALALGVALLTVLSLAGQLAKYFLGHNWIFGFVPLFYVDKEANIPTWYSSLALSLSAILLAAIGFAERKVGSPCSRHWLVLAVIFLFLSADEAAVIHELSIRPLRELLRTGARLYHPWVLPAGVLVLVFFVAYLRFLRALPPRTRRLFLIAGASFVAGSLGVELIGGAQAGLYGKENLTYVALASLEELLEMAAIVVFIGALADYMAGQDLQLSLRFSPRIASAAPGRGGAARSRTSPPEVGREDQRKSAIRALLRSRPTSRSFR